MYCKNQTFAFKKFNLSRVKHNLVNFHCYEMHFEIEFVLEMEFFSNNTIIMILIFEAELKLHLFITDWCSENTEGDLQEHTDPSCHR